MGGVGFWLQRTQERYKNYGQVLVAGGFAGIYFSYGSVIGLEPTVALLLTAFALKLIELVARKDAGITALGDLKGKRINAGGPRSLQHLAMATIIKSKNWSKYDFSLVGELPPSQSQDTMAFCHGTMQAMVHIGMHPDLIHQSTDNARTVLHMLVGRIKVFFCRSFNQTGNCRHHGV